MSSAAYLRRWPAPKTFTDPGDQIEGRLVSFDEASEKYPVLLLQERSGLIRAVRLTQVRLHERIAELLPEPGDVLFIRYDGDATKGAPGVSRTKQFTVEIRRKGSQPPDRPAPPAENDREAGT